MDPISFEHLLCEVDDMDTVMDLSGAEVEEKLDLLFDEEELVSTGHLDTPE
jgi:hypothetical protein